MSAKKAVKSKTAVAPAQRNGVKDLVFLFDVDNTLLDNDRLQSDLFRHIERDFGHEARARYLEIFEDLRNQLGYADYLGALERYRQEKLHDPRFLRMANWLIEYPFPSASLSRRSRCFQADRNVGGRWRSCRTATLSSSRER